MAPCRTSPNPKSKIPNPQSTRRCRKKRRTKPIWNRLKSLRHKELNRIMPSPVSANEAIYERAVVKRGGADFVSRVPAHPLRRRLRSILPISDLSADELVVQPATHPLSPRPREIAPPRCRQCTKR